MEKQNIYQKINLLKTAIEDGFNKDKKGYNYDYVSSSQILAKISPILNNLGIIVIPNVDKESLKNSRYTYSSRKGEVTDVVVEGFVSFKWQNVDDKEDYFNVDMPLLGQQGDISQAYGTALTYAERYMYLKVLGVQTDQDDPDKRNYNNKKEDIKPATNTKTVANINTNITTNTNTDNKVSEAQIKRLWAIAKEKNLTEIDVKKGLKKYCDLDHLTDLTKNQYNQFCLKIDGIKV